MLADEEEIIALKRVHPRPGQTTHAELRFSAPGDAGAYGWDVYLVSDTYIGLDQRHALTLAVR